MDNAMNENEEETGYLVFSKTRDEAGLNEWSFIDRKELKTYGKVEGTMAGKPVVIYKKENDPEFNYRPLLNKELIEVSSHIAHDLIEILHANQVTSRQSNQARRWR